MALRQTFLRVPRLSPSVSFHYFSILTTPLISKGQKGKASESSNTTMFFHDKGEPDKKLFHAVLFYNSKGRKLTLEVYRVVSKTTSVSTTTWNDKVREFISLSSPTKLGFSSKTKVLEKREYNFLLCYVI